tara:strand:- start:404 stop:922 length:519 start_codon:yes stop_codon:yes gene_type:complete
MSFQKAHDISNELAEVVITTGEITLSTWNSDQYFNTQYYGWKSYRVLEVGMIISSSVASVAKTGVFSVGVTTDAASNDVAICPSVDLPAIGVATTPGGTVLSTSRGSGQTSFSMTFAEPSTVVAPTSVDSGGIPRLNAGDSLFINYISQTAGASKCVFFARLAPEIYRELDL